MRFKKLTANTFMIGLSLTTLLGAGMLIGCTGNTGEGGGLESVGETAGQEVSEQGGGESGGEHSGAGEGSEGSGGEGAGGEEGSGAMLAPSETFDMVRSGARLIMSYDGPNNSFTGTVENTTGSVLTRVRIEVHLTDGTELGPTTPIDLAAGEMATVSLPSTQSSFTGWVAHAEVGGGEGGGGESGSESGGEGGGTGSEAGEAAMSSPVIPVGQTWEGTLGGLAVFARYDAATESVQSTVQNTLSHVICYVQAEPHMKSGTRTVGELGPDVLGHLSLGQVAVTSVPVSSEPNLAGVSFDGYVVHLEVFDCGGAGPVPHTGGEGAEGGGGEGSGGESGGEGAESGGEEGSGATLGPDDTFDMVRGGARLILSYDSASNSFKGTVENTTSQVLTRMRIEVHLSNGTELGPTTPVDMAPGQFMTVALPSTDAVFTGWIAHAEVGGGESGGEHGSNSGEHGGGEGGGEHSSGSGEHGSG